jgi:hypothetical protein
MKSHRNKSLAQQFCSMAIYLCQGSQNCCVILQDVMCHAPTRTKMKITIIRLLVVLLSIVQGCCPFLGEFSTSGEQRQDPMSGKVTNSSGAAIDSVLIFASSTSYASFTSGISSRTDDSGHYHFSSGFPYAVQWNTCGDRNERFVGINDFALVFVHPRYDTTIALIVRDTSDAKYVIHYASWLEKTDTVLASDQYNFGPIGQSHIIPTIIMKAR